MFILKGTIAEDTGIKEFKPQNSNKVYPWRQIQLAIGGSRNHFPISVLPNEDIKVNDTIEIEVELICSQKGLANGQILTILKLQSLALFNSKK